MPRLKNKQPWASTQPCWHDARSVPPPWNAPPPTVLVQRCIPLCWPATANLLPPGKPSIRSWAEPSDDLALRLLRSPTEQQRLDQLQATLDRLDARVAALSALK